MPSIPPVIPIEHVNSQGFPELSQEAVEYVFPAPAEVTVQQTPAHVVLVIDSTADEQMLQVMQGHILRL